MQWGFVSTSYVPDIDFYQFNVTFPIPFPHKAIYCSSIIRANVAEGGYNDAFSSVGDLSNNGMKVLVLSYLHESRYNIGAYWMAIGY